MVKTKLKLHTILKSTYIIDDRICVLVDIFRAVHFNGLVEPVGGAGFVGGRLGGAVGVARAALEVGEAVAADGVEQPGGLELGHGDGAGRPVAHGHSTSVCTTNGL